MPYSIIGVRPMEDLTEMKEIVVPNERQIKTVAFIEPKAPEKHVFSKVLIPRIGPVLLATMLKEMGVEVRVYAEHISPIDWRFVENADLVGISTLTATAPRAYEIIREVQEANKRATTVIGGPHVTFLPEEALQAGADFVVRGEGEKTLLEVIKYLQGSVLAVSSIPGLSYKKDGVMIHNTPRLHLSTEELDILPTPDFSLVHGWKWNSRMVYPVSLSRGCPFDCTFCSVIKMFGRKYRIVSLEKALIELKHAAAATKGTIFVVDDNFAANPKFTKELLEKVVSMEIKMKWSAQMRVDVAKDPKLLSLLKQAGCARGYFGFESISEKNLLATRKKQGIEDIKRYIEAIKEAGIAIHGMFVFFPDDTREIIKKTVEFVKKNGMTTIQFLALTPFQGTEIHDEMMKNGTLLYGEKDFPAAWSEYDTHKVVFKPEHMSSQELRIALLEAQRKFYSLKYILRHYFWGSKEDSTFYALMGIYAQLVLNSTLVREKMKSVWRL